MRASPEQGAVAAGHTDFRHGVELDAEKQEQSGDDRGVRALERGAALRGQPSGAAERLWLAAQAVHRRLEDRT
jgi:hypothetical protein